MAIIPPPKNWSKIGIGKDEKIWSYMIIVMILMMSIFTVTWVFFGDQNVPEEYNQFEDNDFLQTAINGNQPSNGVTISTLSNGQSALTRSTSGDIYLVAQTYAWVATDGDNYTQGIKLKVGQTYRLHVGSIDFLHGFEIMGGSFIIAIQIVPYYDYVIDFIPTTTGLFRIICNEYCGTGHHTMDSFLEVYS